MSAAAGHWSALVLPWDVDSGGDEGREEQSLGNHTSYILQVPVSQDLGVKISLQFLFKMVDYLLSFIYSMND